MKRFAALALAFGLFLLAAEILLKQYYYGKTYRYYGATEVYWEDQNTLLLYIPHRSLFWTLKPNVHLNATETITGYGLYPEMNRERNYTWTVRVNSKGFRGPDFPAGKPEGEFRVVCLGDSRTLGEGLKEQDTYPSRLQNRLQVSNPDRPIRVINLGVDGWTSYQGLVLLERQVTAYSPDVAVFCYGINDADLYWGTSDLQKARSFDSPLVSVRRALYRSMVFYWIQKQFLRVKGLLFGKTPVTTDGSEKTPRVSLERYAQNLEQVIRVCRRNRIVPLILTLPVNPYYDWTHWIRGKSKAGDDRWKDRLNRATVLARTDSADAALRNLKDLARTVPSAYPVRYALGSIYRDSGNFQAAHAEYTALLNRVIFSEYNRVAQRIALRHNAHLVDMTDTFVQQSREPLFIDDMHPGRKGAERIAEALEGAIQVYISEFNIPHARQ